MFPFCCLSKAKSFLAELILFSTTFQYSISTQTVIEPELRHRTVQKINRKVKAAQTLRAMKWNWLYDELPILCSDDLDAIFFVDIFSFPLLNFTGFVWGERKNDGKCKRDR